MIPTCILLASYTGDVIQAEGFGPLIVGEKAWVYVRIFVQGRSLLQSALIAVVCKLCNIGMVIFFSNHLLNRRMLEAESFGNTGVRDMAGQRVDPALEGGVLAQRAP
jgi:hypothetical protein